MCRPVQCRVCGLTTWAGCGRHVDAVKAQVPAAQRCEGHAGKDKPMGLVGRLLGR